MAGGRSWRPWCLLVVVSLLGHLALAAPSPVDSTDPEASPDGPVPAASPSAVAPEEDAEDKSSRNVHRNEVLHVSNPSSSLIEDVATFYGYPHLMDSVRNFFSFFNTMDNEALLNENLVPPTLLAGLRYINQLLVQVDEQRTSFWQAALSQLFSTRTLLQVDGSQTGDVDVTLSSVNFDPLGNWASTAWETVVTQMQLIQDDYNRWKGQPPNDQEDPYVRGVNNLINYGFKALFWMLYLPNSGIENLFLSAPLAAAEAAVDVAAGAAGAAADAARVDTADYSDYDYVNYDDQRIRKVNHVTNDPNYHYRQPSHNSLDHGVSSYSFYGASSYNQPGYKISRYSGPTGQKVTRYGEPYNNDHTTAKVRSDDTSSSSSYTAYDDHHHHDTTPQDDHPQGETDRSDTGHHQNGHTGVLRYSAYGTRGQKQPVASQSPQGSHKSSSVQKADKRTDLKAKKEADKRRSEIRDALMYGDTWEGIMGPHMMITKQLRGITL